MSDERKNILVNNRNYIYNIKFNFTYIYLIYLVRNINLSGAGTKIRTRDLMITNQLLYQLSYTGNNIIVL